MKFFLCFLAFSSGLFAANDSRSIDVFLSGEGGYHSYRIPALVTAPDGSLLIFCEGRKNNRKDDGDIDMLLKRSTDGGDSWEDTQLIIEEGGDARIKYGNPCPVVDRETGAIILSMNRDYLDSSDRRQGGAIQLMRSEDNGISWSGPIDITDQIKKPSWKHYAQGPGIGIQIEKGPNLGRLIIPANYRESFNKGEPSYSHVIYSDDYGQSWSVGGILGKYTNECQVAEIFEDGKSGLLINMRNHWGRAGFPEKSGKRLTARSFDGGLTWSEEKTDPALYDPPCQASLFRYSWAEDGERSRLIFAHPAGPGRSHLTVRISYDEGHTWPVSKAIYRGSSAYSCLTHLDDGRIGLVYEKDNYRSLTFVAFNLKWLGEK